MKKPSHTGLSMRAFFTMRLFAMIALSVLAFQGCGKSTAFPRLVSWKAEDYFSDTKVIALCQAIEADDLDEIDRLVKEGVDVNVKGKGNVTPLMWAFFTDGEAFDRLLEHGADPNVFLTDDFVGRGPAMPGDSVMELCAKLKSPHRLKSVLAHGGNPNLVNSKQGETPIYHAISQDRRENVEALIAAGADVEFASASSYGTPLTWAAVTDHHAIVLMLLDAGADFRSQDSTRFLPDLTMVIVDIEDRCKSQSLEPINSDDLEKVKEYLLKQGVDFEAARAELLRRRAERKDAFKRPGVIKHLQENVWPQRCANPPWLPKTSSLNRSNLRQAEHTGS